MRGANYMLDHLGNEGLSNVHGENAMVPQWIRGKESAIMRAPRINQTLMMLGLGNSVATPPQGITAEVLVVRTFDELKARAAEAKGKIVLFNQQCDWVNRPTACYGDTAVYRVSGPSAAARVGAVAMLLRSLASNDRSSLPHTGMMTYDSDAGKIPCAAITVEDAEAMDRMATNKLKIVVSLFMEAQTLVPVPQPNVVAELTGTDKKDEIIIVSGHLDSWDVGVGAMDDGGGAFVSWQVLSTLKALKLQPRRTIRLVMWACEELGGIGSQSYFDAHKSSELAKMQLVIESDMGTFTPYGVGFSGNAAATAIMKNIVSQLAPINASTLTVGGGEEDNGPWCNAGAPCATLANLNQDYFKYHHSHGDQMTVQDSTAMDLAAATFAVTVWGVANLDQMLPR
jgi:carboxypeptidase Q